MTAENNIDRKRVSFREFVLRNISTAAVSLGYEPFIIELNKKQTKHHPDGKTVVTTYPAIIYGKRVIRDELGKDFDGGLVFMNPRAKDVSYILTTGERNYRDGKTVQNITINKITHPASHKNLGEWVTSWKDKVINPYIHLNELKAEGLPGILIVVYDKSVAIHKRGEDKLLNRIFVAFG